MQTAFCSYPREDEGYGRLLDAAVEGFTKRQLPDSVVCGRAALAYP